MTLRWVIAALALASGGACTATAPENLQQAKAHPVRSADGATEQLFDGPGLVCGEAFGLVLNAGESMARRDPGIDFLTYQVEGPAGGFVLYEGNAPQPHDDEIQTGLRFPSVIAIHDNRNGAQKLKGSIRARLMVGDRLGSLCRQPASAR